MAYIDTGAYNKWRRQQEQKNAMDDYARQKEEIDNKYQEKPTGLAGLLSNLTRDIKSTGNTLFTTVSALASPFMQKYTDAANKAAQAKGNEELDKIAQKYGYKDRAEAMDRGDGPDDMWNEMQDISNKTSETVKNISDNFKNNAAVQKVNNTTQSQYGADAIRTLRNAANVMGVGLTPVGGAIGGAAEGFADALENSNGTLVDLQSDLSGGKVKSAVNTDLDWGQAAKNAGVGALTGAVTAGVGNKIGNATSGIGSKLLNNRVATSAIGRGAIGGAVGGAVGGGLGAGLEGGDVLGGALQGAGSGALTGGIAGGLTSGARKVGTAITDRLGVTDRVANARQKLMYTPEEKTPIAQVEEQKPYNVIAEEAEIVEPTDLMYGESKLGNRTRKGMVADSISRFGDTLEGAQANVTRAAARDLGIESTGKAIENVRKKTGLTSLKTQADLARELTGGEDSLMDSVQRIALSASEDGKPFRVDTSQVEKDVANIVNKYADDNILDVKKTVQTLQRTVGNNNSDVITISNRLKSQAASFRGKGITDPTPKDAAMAKIYTEIANNLDDLSYKAIPKSNVNDMFDVTISEMRGRANQASTNGNNDIANAYNTAADSLDAQPRTIEAFRRFKKDFVDVAKIDRLTSQAENGAAQNLGQSGGGVLKKIGNVVTGKAVNAGLAKAGGVVNSLADKIGNGGTTVNRNTTPIPTTQISPDLQNVYNLLGLEIGMNEARSNASDNARNREFKNLEDQLTNTMADIDTRYQQDMSQLGGYGTAQSDTASQLLSQMNTISGAMNNALAAGDMKAYSQLADLYKDAYDIYKTQAADTTSKAAQKLSKTQQQANAASLALNELENMDPGYAYTVRDIPLLNLVNLNGNRYSSTADSLAMQIGYMLSGANIKEDEAKQIGSAYVPQPFDSEAVRNYKLQQARRIIQQYQNAYVNDENE